MNPRVKRVLHIWLIFINCFYYSEYNYFGRSKKLASMTFSCKCQWWYNFKWALMYYCGILPCIPVWIKECQIHSFLNCQSILFLIHMLPISKVRNLSLTHTQLQSFIHAPPLGKTYLKKSRIRMQFLNIATTIC